jgi:hypothetical protein
MYANTDWTAMCVHMEEELEVAIRIDSFHVSRINHLEAILEPSSCPEKKKLLFLLDCDPTVVVKQEHDIIITFSHYFFKGILAGRAGGC